MNSNIKFCVDESVDFPVVAFLRKKGFDVVSISEDCPSLEDDKILNLAFSQGRIMITNDKDFGNLIFKQKIKKHGRISKRKWQKRINKKVIFSG